MKKASNQANLINTAREDAWVEKPKFRISTAEAKHLSEIDELRSVIHIGLEWTAIILAIALCSLYWNPFLYVITVMWIGARQHALLIMMHEGTHYRLFKNRKLNDWVAELFLAWPHFITNKAYRLDHFAHHQHVNTDDDPDWVRKKNSEWEFPMSLAKIAKILFKDISGFNSLHVFSEMLVLSKTPGEKYRKARLKTALRVAYYLTILTALIYFGAIELFLLYWVVPILTWLPALLRLRSIAEHFGIGAENYASTRTTMPNLFERMFFIPKNVNYHIEHHLYPGVPNHALPKLHAALMKLEGYKESAHVTHGYWRAVKECLNLKKTSST